MNPSTPNSPIHKLIPKGSPCSGPFSCPSFAEQALPLAVAIARRAGARLDLAEVHALYCRDEPKADWAPYDPNLDAECKRTEQLYLDATAKWVTAVAPLPVTTAVLAGSAVLAETTATAILERARDRDTDLIVMASHDRDLLSRCAFGSVALELVRRSGVPVLRVPTREPVPQLAPEPDVARVVIPLDGSALAERVLEPALELAHLMGARCTLLRVVESRAPAGTGSEEEYLERTAGCLRRQDLEIRTRVVVAPDAARAIVAEGQPNGLVAVATHGHGGWKRVVMGSVAERVLRSAASPVLVYHPTGAAALRPGRLATGAV